MRPVGIRIVALCMTSVAFSVSFTEEAPVTVPVVLLGMF